MAGSGKRELREHLKSLSPAECRELVLELWNRFPAVRDYFESRFSPDQGRAVLDRAKNKIAREFSTSTLSPSGKPRVAKQVISDFRKSNVRAETVVELMLFYVGEAIQFCATFGDEVPIPSILNTFAEAVRLAADEGIVSQTAHLFENALGIAESSGGFLHWELSSEWLPVSLDDSETAG